MQQDYFVGLDLDSNAIGFAVTNPEYEIIRKHGKDFWGVRLFELAKTGEERRLYRLHRRTRMRKTWRLHILQELFEDAVLKVDDGFFLRMKESRYVPEDKRQRDGSCPTLPYSLFVDETYTDKDYHKEFPTVYHLRKYLMETKDTPDIRLVYLALHHILKNRGHFLLSGDMEMVREFKGIFSYLVSVLKAEELDFELFIDETKQIEIEKILKDKTLSVSAKIKRIGILFGMLTPCEKAVFRLLCGGKIKLSDLFSNPAYDDCETPKICFADGEFDGQKDQLEAVLCEQYMVVELIKVVYDGLILSEILKNHTSISDAKISQYEKHKKDLCLLKKTVRKYLTSKDYKKVFVLTEKNLNNYAAYVGMTKKNGKKMELIGKRASKEDFYAFIKKEILAHIPDGEEKGYIKAEMENETFLPKLVGRMNIIIPHQIHLYELDAILNNMKDKHPIIHETADKIRETFLFKLPSYVGPLNGIKRGTTTSNWAMRISNAKIYPWNFDTVIDKEASAERSIKRSTQTCCYLKREDVLPKFSPLYNKCMVLDALNMIRLDGKPLSVEVKQGIYKDLFLQHKKVRNSMLKQYLVKNNLAMPDVKITGAQLEYNGGLRAYHDLKERLPGVILSEDDMENIVLNITLFGQDKALLYERLKRMYPSFTKGQIHALCDLSYTGWGRFSRAFLTDIVAPIIDTGEALTIIEALWERNDTLKELLSKKYLFFDEIEKENYKDNTEAFSYDMIDELFVSPVIKRQIRQTLKVLKEITKVMDKMPKRVFLNVTNVHLGNKNTSLRKRTLLNLYRPFKDDTRDWMREILSTPEGAFKNDRLYLYYLQRGICIYSGEEICLSDLYDSSKYDIDHIYPQSLTMDQSIHNKVLVKKSYNEEKSNRYPIDAHIQKQQGSFWINLLEAHFMSEGKYNRLVRQSSLNAEELAGFVEANLSDSSYGATEVVSVLKKFMPETEIVCVQEKYVNFFRQDYGFLRIRELNSLYHAKDAYLNIVVGNGLYVKFTSNPYRYLKENPDCVYNLRRLFTNQQDIVRDQEIAWVSKGSKTIGTIKRYMNKNSILLTRQSYVATGAFFDLLPVKKGNGQIPLKSSDKRLCDINKYGGYNKLTGSYFMLVESVEKNGDLTRSIEYVSLHLALMFERDNKKAITYLETIKNLNQPRIILPKIKIGTLLCVNGFYLWLYGRSGKQLVCRGANQLLLNDKESAILKRVLRFVDGKKTNEKADISAYAEPLSAEELLTLYDVFIYKLEHTVFYERLSAQARTLNQARGTFIKLSMEEKCMVLSEILHMFQGNSNYANLTLIGGPSYAGGITFTHMLKNIESIRLIDQSMTGMYEKSIDLLTVET